MQAACAAGAAREDVVGLPQLVPRAALADAHVAVRAGGRSEFRCCDEIPGSVKQIAPTRRRFAPHRGLKSFELDCRLMLHFRHMISLGT